MAAVGEGVTSRAARAARWQPRYPGEPAEVAAPKPAPVALPPSLRQGVDGRTCGVLVALLVLLLWGAAAGGVGALVRQPRRSPRSSADEWADPGARHSTGGVDEGGDPLVHEATHELRTRLGEMEAELASLRAALVERQCPLPTELGGGGHTARSARRKHKKHSSDDASRDGTTKRPVWHNRKRKHKAHAGDVAAEDEAATTKPRPYRRFNQEPTSEPEEGGDDAAEAARLKEEAELLRLGVGEFDEDDGSDDAATNPRAPPAESDEDDNMKRRQVLPPEQHRAEDEELFDDPELLEADRREAEDELREEEPDHPEHGNGGHPGRVDLEPE